MKEFGFDYDIKDEVGLKFFEKLRLLKPGYKLLKIYGDHYASVKVSKILAVYANKKDASKKSFYWYQNGLWQPVILNEKAELVYLAGKDKYLNEFAFIYDYYEKNFTMYDVRGRQIYSFPFKKGDIIDRSAISLRIIENVDGLKYGYFIKKRATEVDIVSENGKVIFENANDAFVLQNKRLVVIKGSEVNVLKQDGSFETYDYYANLGSDKFCFIIFGKKNENNNLDFYVSKDGEIDKEQSYTEFLDYYKDLERAMIYRAKLKDESIVYINTNGYLINDTKYSETYNFEYGISFGMPIAQSGEQKIWEMIDEDGKVICQVSEVIEHFTYRKYGNLHLTLARVKNVDGIEVYIQKDGKTLPILKSYHDIPKNN